jgi:hypothetical protein
MDQLLLATWLFGYYLCIFLKGHNVHIRSPFLVSFFLNDLFFQNPSIEAINFIFFCIFNMASPSDLLLTSTNYFQWKPHMKDLLRSKGLYHITLGKEQEPTNDDKYTKWINGNDEAHGLIKMSISLDLRFHLQKIESSNKSWEKIEAMFVKHNIIRAHQLENQLMT